MSKGPKVHEIFSNSALGKTSTFLYDSQESKQQVQLSKKKNGSQTSGMKKFGGYKPKILGGQSDFLALQADDTAVSRDEETRTNQTLVKPQPWIIGDKDVPMVLEPLGDDLEDVDENGNSHVNGHVAAVIAGDHFDDRFRDVERSLRTHSIHSDTSTLMSQQSDREQGLDNPAASFMSISDTSAAEVHGVHINGNHHDDGHSADSDTEVNKEVFIPAPDYDEEEQTLDFAAEDTDDPDTPDDQQKNPKARPLSKVYVGEDLSHFLTDDEEDVELRQKSNKNTISRRSAPDAQKLNQKHSIFKQNTVGKNKRHSGSTNTGFSSVRNFSYADSKFGTKGKNKSRNLPFTELSDDGDRFLDTSSHQSSYESFLRSRTGEAPPVPDSNNMDLATDSGNLKGKHDTLWKKMTLRFKHKLSKVN